ncbi:MAG TPA: hypothetical protein VFM14_05110 [Gemmatimonadales bacterium]|nr:hypothetical protein [Gemmatimonadales bacterium]
MLRRSVCVLWLAAGTASAQQDLGHRFDVTPSTPQARVGDPVTLHFSISLHERDLITDSVPRPVGELPDGVRILSVRKLVRRGDRALTGEATVAIYRTGTTTLPTFAVPFLRVSANMRGTIKSEPAQVEIASVAPPGNPPLKDLKSLAVIGGVDWLPLGLGAGIVAALLLAARRSRRRRPTVRPSVAPSSQPSPDPYEWGLSQLAALDPTDLPAAVDVVRGCLAAAGVPALECTTSELLHVLPTHLNGRENRARLSALLADADLVKFAQGRVDLATGQAYVESARTLLTGWRSGTHRAAGTIDAAG